MFRLPPKDKIIKMVLAPLYSVLQYSRKMTILILNIKLYIKIKTISTFQLQ